MVLLAQGTEHVRWGNVRSEGSGSEPEVAHLMGGRAFDQDGGVRYGIEARPASADRVLRPGEEPATASGGPPASLRRKMERIQTLVNGLAPDVAQQVAAILQEGDAIRDVGKWGSRHAKKELLLSRFAGLPPEGIRLTRVASVLGLRFRADIATEIAGLDEAECATALEALHRSRLVRSLGGGWLEFVHPLFHQALSEDAAPAVQTRLHARAFKLLHARGLDDEAAEHAVRGELIGDAQAIGVLEASGRRALSTGAPRRPARSATFTGRDALCQLMRPRPPAGTGAARMAMIFVRSTNSVSCTSMAPASPATTCPRTCGSASPPPRRRSSTTGSS